MLFTGRAISAEEAERYGLVNKVVPAGRLAEETLSLAKHIAQASPLTLALGKQSFYSQAGLEETQGRQAAIAKAIAKDPPGSSTRSLMLEKPDPRPQLSRQG